MSDASSKAEHPAIKWNPFAGAALVIALYFIAPTIGALLISAFAGGLDTEGVTAQFVFILLTEIVTVGVLIWFLRSRKAKLADIGFNKLKPKHIGIGLLVYPIYFVMFLISVVVVTQFIPAIDVNQEQQLGFDNVQGIVALSLTFVSLVILPPIVEEITVRGMLFTSLRSRLKLLPATLITSAVFAAAHLPAGGAAGPLYIAAVDTFILSLVLCYVREKTDSLWPCITLHAIKNGIAYVSLFIAPLIWTTL